MQHMAAHLTQATIEGEGGTGKTLAARALHAAGPAAKGPFLACRAAQFFCGLDGESLWGWSEQILAHAAGGMLFLDGVDHLSASQQALLCEFLGWFDDRRFQCLRQEGHERDALEVLPQLVFSSSVALRPSLGLPVLFREDVASRLCAVRFRLPPLSERREDIPMLAQVFIQRFARTYGKPVRGLGPGTIAPLLRYEWPGNVRELENVITAAALETESQWIRPIDLPPLTAKRIPIAAGGEIDNPLAVNPNPSPESDLNLDHAIHSHVVRVLQRTRGNKLRAAQLLGISRSTLYRILGSEQEAAG
jgi:DNA-binding NtrC family response regulator